MKFLYIINCSSFFRSHFFHLALSLRKNGHDVTIAAGNDDQKKFFESFGMKFYLLPMTRSGKGIIGEIKAIISLKHLLFTCNADCVHMLTIKPVLYGGIVNRVFVNKRPKKVIFSITGLGSSSMSQDISGRLLWKCIKIVYKFVLQCGNSLTVFENDDDRNFFSESINVLKYTSRIVNGAGVDISEFSPSNDKNEKMTVILVARLLKDKGIREYIEAGRILKESNEDVELQLIGKTDLANPSSMTDDEIELAHNNRYILYKGYRKDIANCYQEAHIACLPSYREGLPKSLIEAISCGLPIVTTDVPGCRQMVHGGSTGLLVPEKDAISLAKAIKRLLDDRDTRESMGRKSRDLAISRYSKEKIAESFFEIYGLMDGSEQ
ncbi:MAG: glycosyltransferase family 4 protein [Vibrio sp.]|uniref:glycosyltransferase family 4 protein n=1 Tax=Vibrio TaxID=662 RepID=UPI001ED370D4|nr:glycosyltransferase family 4 protein [Vibrio sp.]NRB68594.1 glycosyltransferase family 4 protein [Vibrio sp.]